MLSLIVLLSYTQAAYVPPPLVSMAVERHDGGGMRESGFLDHPERGIVSVSLDNCQYYYRISLEIGTPPQDVWFTLDTGSSDLWVADSSNPYCQNATVRNCSGTIFDHSQSRTFQNLSTAFEIEYGDRTQANGTLARDDLVVGGQRVHNAVFAVADSANSSTCVFGIGFEANEATAQIHRNGSGVYPLYRNVPVIMKDQGLTYANAYSLWLNDKDAGHGGIIFGAVDHAKYEGPLMLMPMYNYYHQYLKNPTQLRVMLDGLSGRASDGTWASLVDFSIAMLLDSGTSFAYFPQEVLDVFGNSLNYSYADDLGYFFGPCSPLPQTHYRLNFSGLEIDVPTEDLLVRLLEDDNITPFELDGKDQCVLAMGAAADPYTYILGDVFLRSMYVVYDLDNYEIAIAQAKPNVTSSDIEIITSRIPAATPVALYNHTSTNNLNFTSFGPHKTYAHTSLLTSTPSALSTSLIPTQTLSSIASATIDSIPPTDTGPWTPWPSDNGGDGGVTDGDWWDSDPDCPECGDYDDGDYADGEFWFNDAAVNSTTTIPSVRATITL